jgi:hypothetical protein
MRTFIEIKMELSARRCICLALGQLLEYAHYPDSDKAERLLVVGAIPAKDEEALYLRELRRRYAIPLYYTHWDWERDEIVAEV